jgi:hypothetical protein
MHFQSHPFLSFSLLLVFWGDILPLGNPKKTRVTHTKDCSEKKSTKITRF